MKKAIIRVTIAVNFINRDKLIARTSNLIDVRNASKTKENEYKRKLIDVNNKFLSLDIT